MRIKLNLFKAISLIVVAIIDGSSLVLIYQNNEIGWPLAFAGVVLTIFWVVLWRDVTKAEDDDDG